MRDRRSREAVQLRTAALEFARQAIATVEDNNDTAGLRVWRRLASAAVTYAKHDCAYSRLRLSGGAVKPRRTR